MAIYYVLFFQKTFSKNDKNTIEPKSKRAPVGQRDSLSPGDIMQARVLYNCPSKCIFVVFQVIL